MDPFEEYAHQVNKQPNQLTRVERQIALLNHVMSKADPNRMTRWKLKIWAGRLGILLVVALVLAAAYFLVRAAFAVLLFYIVIVSEPMPAGGISGLLVAC